MRSIPPCTGAAPPLISHDEATLKLMALARSVARTPSTVLLSGESGVGKEVFARAIHAHSPRADKPFVAVNCAALPSSLLESELFGHERGAFSGAVARHVGLFERANGGSILLDEVSEISQEMQAKLLRVLQERVMLRVGGGDEVKLDVRVIATTNRDLRQRVDQGQFRLDLYYRLSVFPIHIPPLRQRPRDIEPLVMAHLARFIADFSSPLQQISEDAIRVLCEYSYPGNVRELVNILERAVILAAEDTTLRPEHLVLEEPITPNTQELQGLSESSDDQEGDDEDDLRLHPRSIDRGRRDDFLKLLPGSEPLTDVRRKIILGTLERFDGNRTRTAEALGVSLRTIRNKLRGYRDSGIQVPEPGEESAASQDGGDDPHK